MSLLAIVQNAAADLQLPDVTTVIGNGEKNVKQLLRQVVASGNALRQMKNGDGDGWSVLERINEFQTSAGVAEYALPSDFKYMLTDTAWKKDKYWLMRGSLSGKQWQRIRNRKSSTPYNVFRILRASNPSGPVSPNTAPNTIRKFTLEPAPGDSQTLVYEYVSKAWWVSADGSTFKETPTADDDESLFGDHIHELDIAWRWKQKNGFNFAADLAIFEDYRDKEFGQDVPKQPIELGRRHNRGYSNSDVSDFEWGHW